MITSKFKLFLFFIFILSKTKANEDLFDNYKSFVDQIIGIKSLSNIHDNLIKREKREENKSTSKESKSSEENDKLNQDILLTINAKIIFYKNKTRVIKVEKGPSVYVYPNKEILLDYHNGTIIKINSNGSDINENDSKNRKRRFASIDGLYMANGMSFDEKNSENFGEDDFDIDFRQENNLNKYEEIKNKQKMEKNVKNNFEEFNEEEDEFKKRRRGNLYWLKPLYGKEGRIEEQNKRKILNRQYQNNVNSFERDEEILFDPDSKIFPQNIIEKYASPGIPNKEIQPPSSSPNSWLQQRLNSNEPLSDDEKELMINLLNKLGKNDQNEENNLNYYKNDEEIISTTTLKAKINNINQQKILSSSNIKYKFSSPTQKHQPPIGSVPLPTK